MGIRLDQLTASPELFYDFSGELVVPTSHIRLPLMVRDLDCQATMMTDFLIINCPSAYNVVMGRPAMNELNLVVSIRALVIKFSTPNGNGCIRGEQHSARRCYEEIVKTGLRGKKVNVVSGGRPQVISERGISHNMDPCELDYD